MAAECEAKVVVNVMGLGQEISLAKRFETANTPEAVHYGYGTLAAAAFEALTFGQVAASVVDLIVLKSVDNTLYVNIAAATPTTGIMKLEAGEVCCFRPANSAGTATSVYVGGATAESKYEYLVVGQSS